MRFIIKFFLERSSYYTICRIKITENFYTTQYEFLLKISMLHIYEGYDLMHNKE